MLHRARPRRTLAAVVATALCVGLGAFAASSTPPVQGSPPAVKPAPPEPLPPPAEGWKEVDRLVDEQKVQEALDLAGRLRAAAQEKKDEPEWARGLIREVQLRMALHGFETAVRFLREQPWPESALPHTLLDLFYAHSLVTYAQAYGWEIGQREEVASTAVPDLKAWTREQIHQEAQKAYLAAWDRRESWQLAPVSLVEEFVAPGSYPKEIRGTLRDAVSYLFAELLADSSLWSPRQSSEVYLLPLPQLIAGEAAATTVAEPGAHPLAKLAAVLGDLEAWHRAGGRPEAAFEAHRQRLDHLQAHFSAAGDRAALRADLAAQLDKLGKQHPWWSYGQATLAEWVRQGDEPDALVRARELALAGAAAHPDSVGGYHCQAIVAGIESSEHSLTAMGNDSPGRRSLQVEHRNTPRLYFRAYAVDLDEQLRTSRDYNLLPGYQEIPKLMAGKPDAAWTVDLPPTPDFRSHRTFVTPPLTRNGLYVIVGSVREDFAAESNRRSAVTLMIGDLVLLSRPIDQGVEARVLAATSGQALAGATVELWRFDWNKGHRREQALTTDAGGRVTVRWEATGSPAFLIARHQGDAVVDANHYYPSSMAKPGEVSSALLYTDRSVYRPGQTLHWKAVAYQGSGGSFHTRPKTALTVQLVDANRQVVAEQPATTNAFGSAAGEIPIPAGRLLGSWLLRTNVGGQSSVQVEEYKRPTFEVAIDDPAAALRLNRPAHLTGKAKYYFGLPVVAGGVRWHVMRQPVYPRWWWWYGGGSVQSQVVAAGTAELGDDGAFSIDFTPAADEREAATPGVSYSYQLTAEVTDEGGETRQAQRSFRLGFVTVEATVEAGVGFFRAGQPATLTVHRRDLDGTPRAGEGKWRLVRLRQPEKTLLPADQPLPRDPRDDKGAKRYQTPGDRQRPRWNPQYVPEQVMAQWADGEAVRDGELVHDEDGLGEVDLGSLPPGAYRLRYATRDDFGAPFEVAQELLVAGAGTTPLALPAIFRLEQSSVPLGGTARLLVGSGLPDQPLYLEIHRRDRPVERRRLEADGGAFVVEVPIGPVEQGGIQLQLIAERDHQLMPFAEQLLVPWDDRELKIELGTFRDLLRPGTRETWTVTLRGADDKALGTGTAELLAYMYDRSLDLFAPHSPPSALSVYPGAPWMQPMQSTLRPGGEVWREDRIPSPGGYPNLISDRLRFLDSYGIGGPGMRALRGLGYVGGAVPAPAAMAVAEEAPAAPAPPPPPPMADGRNPWKVLQSAPGVKTDRINVGGNESGQQSVSAGDQQAPVELRSQFAETAFWEPQLLSGADGSVRIEFTVPDSVTEWNLWLHAMTQDLRGGSRREQVRTVKELLVRPYLPRFLREGDEAVLQVTVQDAGKTPLAGKLRFEIVDPESGEDLAPLFGLRSDKASADFRVEPGGSTTLGFPVRAPARIGPVAFKVTARAGDWSDGELRPLPVLPGRMHLVQSRFATLRDKDRRVLRFADMAAGDDPSLLHDQLVVTVDGQLFNTVLEALPYLADYPYECTEQTLNRFLSTAIVSRVFADHPAIGKLGKELSERTTPYAPWALDDPNRKMALEESPWLVTARGGESSYPLLRILDPKVAEAQRASSLAKLEKAQTSLGAFPWFPGGPPSPYMTLYLLAGFSRALEFRAEVPQDMVVRAWSYMHRHYIEEIVEDMQRNDCCWESVTFLNYVLSSYPGSSFSGSRPGNGSDEWTGGVFTAAERKQMLDFSFRHWKQHSPLLKAQLALTLQRAGRSADAKLVFDSVMDSAKTTQDEGTFWSPEDRAWLWYNDTIETHAFALRTLSELQPADARRHGLVQWLLLNKKLSHWKSTRATAEVIYSLVQYLEKEGALGKEEAARVTVDGYRRLFRFFPDRVGAVVVDEASPADHGGAASAAVGGTSTATASGTAAGAGSAAAGAGRGNQLVIPGDMVDAKTMSEIVVEKDTKGFLFASATWHFSTEKLPAEARGDFFSVTRTIFRRVQHGDGFRLEPLADGAPLHPGDQLEVQLSIRARAAAEYVHLRDPRPAGCEPETLRSGWKWDVLPVYEEIRDSGANFFFEWLPVGEYTFRHRLRVNLAGTYRVAPATLQSMYAPEFAAYSAGNVVRVLPAAR